VATQTRRQEKPCPTRLITDAVTIHDAFRHGAIAEAIADTLLNEQGGCAIGLTGSWGSGKSTVVELLKGILKQRNPDMQVFVFDAWAHQGDPLRRSFLETLIGWCNEERKWTESKEKWRGVIEELAKRREEIHSENIPHLTNWGVAGALLLLLTPVALQFYAKVQFQYHPRWESFALLASAAPFLFGLAMLIYWQAKPPGESLPSLLFTSTASKIVTKTSKVPDPTSVEFEKYYRELLTEVLAGKNRRILLVIDNLDRVNQEDARSIWASLRVFFDPALATSGDWYKRVWVMVPYDRDGIQDLWDGSGTETATVTSKHFLEKTFQASFRVPPIILSNWEGFLLRQLEFAFPYHSAEEFHTIFRLYDQSLTPETELPTPRNLKIFVNAVGSLHRQWGDTIPLPEQAAFTLLSDRYSGLLALLRGTEQNLAKQLSAMLAPDWQRRLAAIYFNVPPDNAYQVLLAEPVNKALQNGNGPALLRLETNPGFSEVLEESIERYCGVRGGVAERLLSPIATAISHLQGNSPVYRICWGRLYTAAISVRKWQPLNQEIAEGIAKILDATPLDRNIVPLLASVRDSLLASEGSPSVPGATEWGQAVAVILPKLIARDKEAVEAHFRVPGNADQYLAIIRQIRTLEGFENLWKYVRPPSSNMDAILQTLARWATEGVWSEEASGITETLRLVSEDWNWNILISALGSRITPGRQQPTDDMSPVINTIFSLLPFSNESAGVLESAAQNDSLFQYLYTFQQNHQLDSAAACILPLLSSGVPLNQAGNYGANTPQWRGQQGRQLLRALTGNPDSDREITQALASHCLVWRSYTQWREVAEEIADQKTLVARFLKERLKMDNGIGIETLEIVDHVDYWRSVAGEDLLEAILKAKAKIGDLAVVLSNREFSVADEHLHTLALSLDGGDQAYRKFLRDALEACTKAEWREALDNAGELIDLAIRLKADGLVLGHAFQDALASEAEDSLSEDSSLGARPSRINLLQLLDAQAQNVFSKRLLNFLDDSEESPKPLIQSYGPVLAQALLDSGPEKHFERIRKMIEDHDENDLKWLADVLSSWKPSSKAAAIRKDWEQRVRSSLEGEISEEQRASLEKLLTAL
jgi:energy-coupling factor transporter ATP-binding protein EcfA2